MNDNFQRRLWVLLVAAAVALGAWKWVPGTSWDRKAFAAVASGSANGPLFISGEGSRAKPWTLRTFSSAPRTSSRNAPVVVSLGDDPDRFFQSFPPAPIDLAVILKNFQRLGARKAASAAVMSWEKPDPIGLVALEKALDGFESLVMAAPLSKGVVGTAIPPSFRRTSVPLAGIQGDSSLLPLVNRMPISGIILGGNETLTGFSVLESELPSDLVPLMARWEDRVVFSFSLLTVLQRLDLPLDGVEIRLGEFLKLGPAGPIVPIDEFGRFEMPSRSISPFTEISAEALIDGGDDLFPKQAPEPVILRDDRSALDTATRAFSQGLAGVIASMASNGGLSDAHEFRRLSENGEAGVMAGVVVVLAVLAGMSGFVRNIGVLTLLGIGLAGQWFAFSVGSIWLPGVATLVTVAVVGGLALLLRDNEPAEKTMPDATPQPVIPLALEPQTPRAEEQPQIQKLLPEMVVPPEIVAIIVPEPEMMISREPTATSAPPPVDSPPPAPVSEPPPTEESEPEPWWAMYTHDSPSPMVITPEEIPEEISEVSPEITPEVAPQESPAEQAAPKTTPQNFPSRKSSHRPGSKKKPKRR